MNFRSPLFGLALLLSICVACGPPGVEDTGEITTDADASASATTGPVDESGSESGSGTESGTETTSGPTEPGTLFISDSGEDGWWMGGCDPFAQDCPDGEKCVPYASTGAWWDANKCVPVTGSQAAGEPCVYGGVVEATDDCDSDSACWNVQEVDGEWTGTCHPFCMGSPEDPMCPAGSFCPLTGDGTIALCLSNCDPLLQDCDDGFGCYWGNAEFVCVLVSQDLPPGAACSFINDCERGLGCVTAELLPDCQDVSCCTPFCELMLGDAQCDAVPGTSCVPFWEEGLAPAGYEHIGICVLAP